VRPGGEKRAASVRLTQEKAGFEIGFGIGQAGAASQNEKEKSSKPGADGPREKPI